MNQDRPKYRDYLDGSSESPIVPERVPDPYYQDAVYVMRNADGHWTASWQGEFNELGAFDGDRESAITWAKERSKKVWVYSDETRDMELLGDPDE